MINVKEKVDIDKENISIAHYFIVMIHVYMQCYDWKITHFKEIVRSALICTQV